MVEGISTYYKNILLVLSYFYYNLYYWNKTLEMCDFFNTYLASMYYYFKLLNWIKILG